MFFSSFFDTGSKSQRDLELGRAMLQILTLSEYGPVLTALHAFNSELILRQADDHDFLTLVERGRITFRSRFNGQPPRERFLDMLSTAAPVHLGAWPDLVRDGVDHRELRHATAAFFRDGKPRTTIEAVDENVDRVKRILAAIDIAVENGHELQPELAYPRSFRDVFEHRVRTRIDPRGGAVNAFLHSLCGADFKRDSRTDLYDEIWRRGSDDVQADARAFVDAISNALVAESLSLPLHSVSDSQVVSAAHAGDPDVGEALEIPIDDVSVLPELRLQWNNFVALAPYGPGRMKIGTSGTASAIHQLADTCAKAAQYAPSGASGATKEGFTMVVRTVKETVTSHGTLLVATMASAGAAWHFVGAAGGILTGLLTAALGNQAGKYIERRGEAWAKAKKHREAERKLKAFMDHVGRST